MKIILMFAALLGSLAVCSQDTLKIKQIDSLINFINTSDFQVQQDSLKQDIPGIGLSMRTYLTMMSTGTELKKYINKVYSETQENGMVKKVVTSNTFYFDHNKLIKVEEFAMNGDNRLDFDWYYSEDKPIYYTARFDKSEERAKLLLAMGKGMLKQMGFE